VRVLVSEPFNDFREEVELHEHVSATAKRARGKAAPFVGALEPLAECTNPYWSHSKRHLRLLGVAGLPTQAESDYGKFRCGSGYWNLDLRSCAGPA
jgi:hypothetical protein